MIRADLKQSEFFPYPVLWQEEESEPVVGVRRRAKAV